MPYSYRCFVLLNLLSDLEAHSAEDISEFLEVSKRTVNTDIKELKEMVSKFGGEIVNRQNGYYLNILDEERFNAVNEKITRIFMKYPIVNGKPESFGREFDICRIILSTEDKITNDDICDKLFVSKETIKEDLKQVRVILSSFGLSRDVTKKNKNIVGKEFNIRNAYIGLYNPVDELYDDDLLPANEFEDGFYDEFKNNDIYRKAITDYVVLNYHKTARMVRDNADRLILYLNIMVHRIRKGKYVKFSSKDFDSICRYNEYEEAFHFLKKLNLDVSEEVLRNEALGMAIFVLMYTDYSKLIDMHDKYSDIYINAAKMADEAAILIERDWKFPISKVDGYYRSMIIEIIPLLFQARYGFLGAFRNYIKTNNDEHFADPFSVAMMQAVNDLFNNYSEGQISRYNLTKLTQTFNSIVSRIELLDKEKHIGVYSQFGEHEAEDLIEIIRKSIPSRLIGNIETVVPTKGDNKPYDLLIVQTQYWIGTRDKTISVDFIPTFNQIIDIYKALLKLSKETDLGSRLFENNVSIIKDCHCTEKYQFIDMIAEKYGSDLISKNRISFDLSHYGRLVYNDGVLVLLIKKELIGKIVLDVYEMTDTMLWRKRPVEYVVLSSICCDDALEKGRMYKDFFYYLSSDKKNVKRLVEGESIADIASDMCVI